MRPFGALISYQEAKEIIDRHIHPLTRTEPVLLNEAVNRILAEDCVAKMDVPPFNRAAMDGYAVKAKDTFGAGQFKPKVFKIIGELHAGEIPAKKIKSGECVQISTGAVMPEGADAVMMVEDTEREGNEVKFFKSITPGSNVGKMGGDIKEGSIILKAGILLDAGKVGVLASQGLSCHPDR
jgi:Molybdopterin biosynthesis enzyme